MSFYPIIPIPGCSPEERLALMHRDTGCFHSSLCKSKNSKESKSPPIW